MLGYIKKKLQEYEHIMPKRVQTCPYSPESKRFGTEAQAHLSPAIFPTLDTKVIKSVQKIMGSILYYTCAVDMMVLKAVNSIAVEQTKATEQTMALCKQLLYYLSHNANTKMVLNIHSDASYLLEANAHSHACSHFFIGWKPKDGEPICLNGAFHVNHVIRCGICGGGRTGCIKSQ
jgi:hypothetical protein